MTPKKSVKRKLVVPGHKMPQAHLKMCLIDNIVDNLLEIP